MKNAIPPFKLDRFKTRPSEPAQLMAALQAIFPQFDQSDHHFRDEVEKAEGFETYGYVMYLFTEFFTTTPSGFSDRQYRALGYLLNASVTDDDDLEAAVSTGFLEHLRQIDGYRVLSPYLSKKAKQKTHA